MGFGMAINEGKIAAVVMIMRGRINPLSFVGGVLRPVTVIDGIGILVKEHQGHRWRQGNVRNFLIVYTKVVPWSDAVHPRIHGIASITEGRGIGRTFVSANSVHIGIN